jgi:hypothetical protein
MELEGCYIGFEALPRVVMKVTILQDIARCSPYMNRRFGGKSVHIITTRRYVSEYGNFHFLEDSFFKDFRN